MRLTLRTATSGPIRAVRRAWGGSTSPPHRLTLVPIVKINLANGETALREAFPARI